jgi:hypothetical protein
MTTSKKTKGGIVRPKTGVYATWQHARGNARRKNFRLGRGYRALKAQDGSYGVVFRPAVANNKQRRVREVI